MTTTHENKGQSTSDIVLAIFKQLFYVLLMMGAMDARNMWSNLAVNKYLHTVASRWIYSNCKNVILEVG